jgi:hypothetical protein
VRDLDATLQYDPRNVTASKVTFTADPKSIDTGLPNFDKELASDEWVGSTPVRFVSTRLEPTGARTGRLHGDLTLKGVTSPRCSTSPSTAADRISAARPPSASPPKAPSSAATFGVSRMAGAIGETSADRGGGVQQGPMSATHESRRDGGRYSAVSIVLHWTIAAAIVSQVVLGWRMTDMDEGLAQFEQFQLHKSLGITILLLSLLRLVWRLTHPPRRCPTTWRAGRSCSPAPPTWASTWG